MCTLHILDLQSSEEETDDEDVFPVDDSTDSEGFDIQDDDMPTAIKVDSYVEVKYELKREVQHYVGQVVKVRRQDDLITVSFLKKCGTAFIKPEKEDVDIISEYDIVQVLPNPIASGGTARASKKLSFAIDMEHITK